MLKNFRFILHVASVLGKLLILKIVYLIVDFLNQQLYKQFEF